MAVTYQPIMVSSFVSEANRISCMNNAEIWNHPISLDKARSLVSGSLGEACKEILSGCCVPIFWQRLEQEQCSIAHNGTLTIVRTPKKLIGVTAAHVIQQYEVDLKKGPLCLQLGNQVVNDLKARLLAVSTKLDIATFELDEELVQRLGKVPLGVWPPKPPQEGRGIMIAGFPGVEREESKNRDVIFGLVTILGVARRVTDRQITWLMEREHIQQFSEISVPPVGYDFGGISGGPLISGFESEQFIAHYCFSGIVVQHPDYGKNTDVPIIERLVCVRADAISDSGMIAEW